MSFDLFFSFRAYDVTMVTVEDECGWNMEMLKSVFASGDVDASLPRFVGDSRPLPLAYHPALEEVNMADSEKVLSFLISHGGS